MILVLAGAARSIKIVADAKSEAFILKKFFVSAMLIFFIAVTANAQVIWRLDGDIEKTLPRNFRTMTDAWHIEMYYDDGNREGLENLNASASGQPSLPSLQVLCEKLKTLAKPDANIYIVDLREESHGFAEDYPVSFYVEKNRGNYYRGYEAEIEVEQLESLQGKLTEFVPLGNYDKAHYQAVTFAPQKILTEEQAATQVGLKYFRVPATDMMFPSPQAVDKFLDFVATLQPDDWLHFHCQAGHGRTTTFLIMYDILKNPQLSLEDICKRQYYLGGTNFLEHKNFDKIKLFYRYAHSDKKISWSEYWQKNL